MKKIQYVSILMVALAVSSCSNFGEDDGVQLSKDAVGFLGTVVSDEGSRTAYENTDTSVKVAWEKRDKIGVFAEVGGTATCANYAYMTSTEGASSEFWVVSGAETVEWADENSSHDFYAYYPYVKAAADVHAVPVTLPSEQEWDENDQLAHLDAADFMWASALDKTKAEVGEGNVIPLQFHHLFSVLQVRIKASQYVAVDAVKFRCKDGNEAVSFDSGVTVDLATAEIDASAGTTSNEISIVGSRILKMGAYTDFFMMVSPGHAGKTFEFVAVVDGNEVVFAERTVGPEGLKSGKTLVVSADFEVSDEDAFLVEDLSAGGTANTYYVSKPSMVYKFDATVKGNGQPFSGSFISYTAEDLKIDPACVLVVWYNSMQSSYTPWAQLTPIPLDGVQLGEDGYVYFQTPSDFINGNVLLAVFDKEIDYDNVEIDDLRRITNANLLWSWNIVAAEGYDIEATAATKGGYTFMSRDLGAIIDPEDVTNDVEKASTSGNYYQYGRKDPFPSIPDCTSANVTYMTGLTFTATYTPITALDQGSFCAANWGVPAEHQILGNTTETIARRLCESQVPAEAVAAAAAVPYVWAYEIGWGQWIADDGGEAWSKTSKTIYDPCPAGWRMMTEDAWNTLIDNEPAHVDKSTNRGFRFDSEELNGLYFSTNTLRGTNGFGNDYIGSCGVKCYASYAVSGHESSTQTRIVRAVFKENFSATDVDNTEITFTAENKNNAQGFCVRCIKAD